jgi:hypothetical protein
MSNHNRDFRLTWASRQEPKRGWNPQVIGYTNFRPTKPIYAASFGHYHKWSFLEACERVKLHFPDAIFVRGEATKHTAELTEEAQHTIASAYNDTDFEALFGIC